jgi:hypothetical protein
VPATKAFAATEGQEIPREVSEDTSFIGQASTPQFAAFRYFAHVVLSV